jgi:hypothetical protein
MSFVYSPQFSILLVRNNLFRCLTSLLIAVDCALFATKVGRYRSGLAVYDSIDSRSNRFVCPVSIEKETEEEKKNGFVVYDSLCLLQNAEIRNSFADRRRCVTCSFPC